MAGFFSHPFTMRLLLVEDEPRLARSVSAGLVEEGFEVEIAADGQQAEGLALAGAFDVLVVDWRLPGQDGRTLVERLRAAGLAVPILMLTARTEVESRVAGLDAGADDYLGKPFAFEELLARLRALTRRSVAPVPGPVLRAGALLVDTRQHTATLDGVPMELRPKEFALLALLAAQAGAVVARADIAEHVWGDPFVSDNALDVTVSGLRTRLADATARGDAAGAEIETVRGVGYRLATR